MQDGRGYEDDRGFDRGYGERRSAQSTGPQQHSRGNGRTPRLPEESTAPARAQQARSRRSSDSSEWDSSEWEKLSDVDYWAELASDKSLKTTAQPAAQARSGPDRDTEALMRLSPSAGAAPRQDPATGLPVRSRPQPAAADLAPAAAGRADFTPAPVPASGIRDQSRAAAVAGDPRPARYADPAGLPSPGRAQPAGRRRVDPDDDPLTSPSFPRIPADDSRSYRNGRADTPPRGSRVPAPHPVTTQQYPSYSSPAPDYNGNGSRDTGPTYPNGYRPDPLLSHDPYGAPAEPPPARPASAAPATAGNPYGSYITPDSQATVSGYSEYSGAHSRPAGNGNGSYLPSALPDGTSQPASNGYWHQRPPTPGSLPAPGAPSYLSGPQHYADPLGADSHQADYGNGYASGYAPPDAAGYPPGGYQAGPQDPAPLDPYERDGYGGYPGYGAPGR